MKSFEYFAPQNLKEGLEMLYRFKKDAAVISGGTDLVIALEEGLAPKYLIDLSHLDELRYIKETNNDLVIGALVNHSSIEKSEIIQKHAYALSRASSEVGTWQIRNLGTIGGNLVTASPAGDTYPPLLVLDAKLKLRSYVDERIIAVRDFCIGYKKTCLPPDEVIVEVQIPKIQGVESSWVKLGKRENNALSIVSASAAVKLNHDKFESVKIALGSVRPTPFLAERASSHLVHKDVNNENISIAAEIASTEAQPRATGTKGVSPEYRIAMAKLMTKRALKEAVERARSKGG